MEGPGSLDNGEALPQVTYGQETIPRHWSGRMWEALSGACICETPGEAADGNWDEEGMVARSHGYEMGVIGY